MSLTSQDTVDSYQRVKNILISQAKPGVTDQYEKLENKYGVRIDFMPFTTLESLTEREYRKQRVYPNDYTAIVFTSRHAIDHFFHLCEEMRLKMSEDTKYFCSTDAIGNYLQKFIVFRKRKVFTGVKSFNDLVPYIQKHKTEKFFLPCGMSGHQEVTQLFASLSVPIQDAVMYRSVPNNLSTLSDVKYDIIAFFTSLEIHSLFENFPSFEQQDRRICVYGSAAFNAVTEKGMKVHIRAGTTEAPSIAVALENYLKLSNPAQV
jgi:uroporphyrinogen-III synthase